MFEAGNTGTKGSAVAVSLGNLVAVLILLQYSLTLLILKRHISFEVYVHFDKFIFEVRFITIIIYFHIRWSNIPFGTCILSKSTRRMLKSSLKLSSRSMHTSKLQSEMSSDYLSTRKSKKYSKSLMYMHIANVHIYIYICMNIYRYCS